jgi:uncharacterized protein
VISSADSCAHVVSLDTTAAQPWKNGGGVTRELLAWPNANEWIFRVSVADIDRDGPFSSFAGVERWFAVLSGAGIVLGTLPSKRITVADAPYQFDGSPTLSCHLIDGPTRDLNVMLQRDRASGWMRAVDLKSNAVRWQTQGSQQSWVRGVFAAVAVNIAIDHQADIVVPAMSLAWQASIGCVAAPSWQVAAQDESATGAAHSAWAFECIAHSGAVI